MSQRSSRGASTLPGEFYTSEEVFERESEQVFSQSWLCVGHVSQVAEPGQFFAVELERESVLITRDDTGAIHAHYNVCRHRGSRICSERSGHFSGAIQCPYHAWTYDLDGSLRAAPNMDEVNGFDRAHYPLHRVPVANWEGLLFVHLGNDPEPFERSLAPLVGRFDAWRIPELRSVHQTVYEVDANWKLLFQNYSECYHCPNVHPTLNRLTPYRGSTNDLESGPVLGGPMTLAAGPGSSMTMSGRACAAPLGDVAGEDLGLVYYYTVFPSLFLSLHPDYVLLHRALRDRADRTRVYCDWLFHPEAIARADFSPSGAIEFWDMTNRQDWELCTISQQGVSSRAYVPGPYAELESQLAAFDRHYLNAMGSPR